MVELSKIHDALASASLPVVSVRSVDSVVTAVYSRSLTAEEETTASSILSADYALADAKKLKILELDNWYYNLTKSGITVSGISLDATIEAQNRFDALVTSILAAISVGMANSSTPFTLYDINGNAITLPANSLMGVLLQYSQILATYSGQYSAVKVQVNNATTVGSVNSISMPS